MCCAGAMRAGGALGRPPQAKPTSPLAAEGTGLAASTAAPGGDSWCRLLGIVASKPSSPCSRAQEARGRRGRHCREAQQHAAHLARVASAARCRRRRPLLPLRCAADALGTPHPPDIRHLVPAQGRQRVLHRYLLPHPWRRRPCCRPRCPRCCRRPHRSGGRRRCCGPRGGRRRVCWGRQGLVHDLIPDTRSRDTTPRINAHVHLPSYLWPATQQARRRRRRHARAGQRDRCSSGAQQRLARVAALAPERPQGTGREGGCAPGLVGDAGLRGPRYRLAPIVHPCGTAREQRQGPAC